MRQMDRMNKSMRKLAAIVHDVCSREQFYLSIFINFLCIIVLLCYGFNKHIISHSRWIVNASMETNTFW